MPYNRERRAFGVLRNALTTNEILREEYQQAVTAVITQYNTAIYENRFVAGGAVERITVAAMRVAGIAAQLVGSETKGADVLLPGGTSISVKSQFTKQRSEFRLINTMGESDAVWSEGTIFVVATRGVGYADPDLVPPDATVQRKDALVLPWRHLRNLWEQRPEYLSQMPIPVKPDSILTGQSKSASRLIAREVLEDMDLPLLLENLVEE